MPGLAGGPTSLRQRLRWLTEQIMEAEASEWVGARPYERTLWRADYCNGYRPRRWETWLGAIHLQASRSRRGSYFTCILEQGTRARRALLAVVQETCVQGVSTRRATSG